MTPEDETTRLRAALRDWTVSECGYAPAFADRLADLAIRRWRSFNRRARSADRSRADRVADLARGLRQNYPGDVVFAEPGEFRHLARHFSDIIDPPEAG